MSSRTFYGRNTVKAGREPFGMSQVVQISANLDDGTIDLTIVRRLRGDDKDEHVAAGLSLDLARELRQHLDALIAAVEVQPIIMEATR